MLLLDVDVDVVRGAEGAVLEGVAKWLEGVLRGSAQPKCLAPEP